MKNGAFEIKGAYPTLTVVSAGVGGTAESGGAAEMHAATASMVKINPIIRKRDVICI
jgi:hypothetical protein